MSYSPLMQITVTTLKCQRCGHGWVPRSADVVQCPHCKSPRWDVLRNLGEIAGKRPRKECEIADPAV